MKRITSMILLLIAGAILTQGFQCASREMSTAKQKYKYKQYDASENAVNQELAKNPANDEAKVLLYDILKAQKKDDEIVTMFNKYQETIKNPIFVDKMQARVYEFWIDKYEAAFKEFEKYQKNNKNIKPLDKAIANMKYVVAVRPEMASPYESIGTFYRSKGDTKNAEIWFIKYMNCLQEGIDFTKSKGVFLYMQRNAMLTKLGTPIKTNGKKATQAALDSIYNDEFTFGNDKLYVYSLKEKNKPTVVLGWRFNPPAHWAGYEKSMLLDITDNPLRNLAQDYYDAEDFTTALKYTKQLMSLTPDANDIRPLLIDLYEKTKQMDALIKEVNTMIQQNPNDAMAYSYLGDVYRITEEFDKSIDAYKKAVSLDKTLTNASLNLAVAYQNKAAKISNDEKKKADANDKYKVNRSAYEPLLKDAVELYKNVVLDPIFANNFDVYIEIINIYYVLNNKAEIEKNVVKLDAIESTLKDDEKEGYYLKLYNLYGKIQDEARRVAIENKLK